MFSQVQSFKQYLSRRSNAIDSDKFSEPRALDLFNEKTFYRAFTSDMLAAKREVVIYSPFVSKFRTDFLKPIIEKLREKNIDVFIFTRPLEEYDNIIRYQIECALKRYEELGVCIFYPGRYIHEKVAVIDREILWQGSLNILSHRASQEIMTRTSCESSATQVLAYLGINKKLAEAYKLKYEKLYRGLANSSRQNFKQKMKIFLLGLVIPIIAWLVVGIISAKPLFSNELIMSLIRLLLAKS